MIEVEVTGGPPLWRCHVRVEGDGSATAHEVTITEEDLERWGRSGRVEDLVRRSFEFLLAREPKESILRSFDLPVIQRYFPEFDEAMGSLGR